MALAHSIGNKVEAAYRRGDLFDKRKQMMQDWADFAASSPQLSCGSDNCVQESRIDHAYYLRTSTKMLVSTLEWVVAIIIALTAVLISISILVSIFGSKQK